jgi:pyruvate dehydrogenase E2 component (dihydrolipoamide acetyltransferase)
MTDSMEEATVSKWLKRPGDAVARGDELVEVETDKATVVYEAEQAGVLEEILVDEGETAMLGAPIARIRTDDALVARAALPQPSPAQSPPAPARGPRREDRARATPVARRLAQQLGVGLEGMSGSGPGGRIVRADVRRGAPTEAGGRGVSTRMKSSPTQRTIAERMVESRSSIPEFTVEAEIAMDTVVRLRAELRLGGFNPLPTYNDFVVRAGALALREFPNVNAGHDAGDTVRWGRVNVGVAVAGEDTLLVPTIHDADSKTVFEIAAAARSLAERARERKLSPADLSDGTFTVSNLGMFGVRRFTAVINPPQAAILAVGEVAERAVVVDGTLVARATMDATLSCDHRVIYGAEAARFLGRMRELLEHPSLLIVDRRSA